MKMTYPFLSTRQADIYIKEVDFIPGELYECVKATTGIFTEGCVYLCCSRNGAKYLVTREGALIKTRGLSSRFIEA